MKYDGKEINGNEYLSQLVRCIVADYGEKTVPRNYVIERATMKGIEPRIAEAMIDALVRSGDMIEPRTNLLQLL